MVHARRGIMGACEVYPLTQPADDKSESNSRLLLLLLLLLLLGGGREGAASRRGVAAVSRTDEARLPTTPGGAIVRTRACFRRTRGYRKPESSCACPPIPKPWLTQRSEREATHVCCVDEARVVRNAGV